MGTIIRVSKGDTRSLDYGSYELRTKFRLRGPIGDI